MSPIPRRRWDVVKSLSLPRVSTAGPILGERLQPSRHQSCYCCPEWCHREALSACEGELQDTCNPDSLSLQFSFFFLCSFSLSCLPVWRRSERWWWCMDGSCLLGFTQVGHWSVLQRSEFWFMVRNILWGSLNCFSTRIQLPLKLRRVFEISFAASDLFSVIKVFKLLWSFTDASLRFELSFTVSNFF